MTTRSVHLSTTPRHLRQLLLVALGQEAIGIRIREAREAAGLSQPELAERLGLAHPQSISNYERGVTEVPPKRLRRIAEITGRPLGFFVGEPAGLLEEAGGPAGRLLDRLAELEAKVEAQGEATTETLEGLERGIEQILARLDARAGRANQG